VLDPAAVQGHQARADEPVPADLDRAAVQGLQARADRPVPADLDPAAVEGRADPGHADDRGQTNQSEECRPAGTT
jgi:hypothetical protein